jgi:hypothetical protein
MADPGGGRAVHRRDHFPGILKRMAVGCGRPRGASEWGRDWTILCQLMGDSTVSVC